MEARVVDLLAVLVPSPDTASWPVLDEDRPERSSREDIAARILNRGRNSPLELIREIVKAGILPIPLHCGLKSVLDIGTNPLAGCYFALTPDGCYLAIALLLLLSYLRDKWPSSLFDSPHGTFHFKTARHTLVVDGDDDGLCFSLVDHRDISDSRMWDIEPVGLVRMYLGTFLGDSDAQPAGLVE
ncbi:hypothetical protein QKT49_gp264 [Acanthamoeba castellanii medusavirus]|uniref:Uncharacterized protein n=1 Tax=Acanthamoeba castellanii medusavirus J1 TaxID=3114988 RepID=A0A3T1CXH7_9VIRU|nr:hypothetical protein QKT49_gp264 [Acanthamoeba castellanii medusavirus]BBI30499.1 hypothetical protein [Acanthamoeba castellanii medusavirus J1]